MQYLLLAKRDKSFVQILGKSAGETQINTKRNINVSDIKLSVDELLKLENFYRDKNMKYELMIESCKDFNQLKESLFTKGYKILPQGNSAKLFSRKEHFFDFNIIPPKK